MIYDIKTSVLTTLWDQASTLVTIIFIVLHINVKTRGKMKVVGTRLYPGYMNFPDHNSSINDYLAAWFHQHTAWITRRECERKGQLHSGSIVDNTVGCHEHMKFGF